MKSGRIIILCTAWSEDYWETPKEAPYPKRRYDELPEWDLLSSNCPVPALGVYIKQTVKGEERDYTHRNFVYLKIKGMKYDSKTLHPIFDFEPIRISKTKSRKLLELLPSVPLFSTIKVEKLQNILKILGEKPPTEWFELIKVEEIIKSWRDYVGKYFLELIDYDLGNEEFENRVAELLNALGFVVKQFGHKVVGEYPDGEAMLNNDIVLIYDCKNTSEFKPSLEDKRKLDQYVRDAKIKYKDKKIYGVFIAKSFGESQAEHLFFHVGSLVYLLYKKLSLGNKFSLAPLRKIIHKKEYLNPTLIDNEWRK